MSAGITRDRLHAEREEALTRIDARRLADEKGSGVHGYRPPKETPTPTFTIPCDGCGTPLPSHLGPYCAECQTAPAAEPQLGYCEEIEGKAAKESGA